MNVLNRLIVSLLLVLAIVLTPVSIVLALLAPATLAGFFTSIGRAFVEGASAAFAQFVCVGIALLVFVVSIVLLFLELQRPPSRRLRVQQVSDGQVEVTDEAIVQRVAYTVSQLADVLRVHPRVAPANKGTAVDVFIEMETNPEVNVPQKTQEVINAVKQMLEQQMGLAVNKIQVQLAYSRKQTKTQTA